MEGYLYPVLIVLAVACLCCCGVATAMDARKMRQLLEGNGDAVHDDESLF